MLSSQAVHHPAAFVVTVTAEVGAGTKPRTVIVWREGGLFGSFLCTFTQTVDSSLGVPVCRKQWAKSFLWTRNKGIHFDSILEISTNDWPL